MAGWYFVVDWLVLACRIIGNFGFKSEEFNINGVVDILSCYPEQIGLF